MDNFLIIEKFNFKDLNKKSPERQSERSPYRFAIKNLPTLDELNTSRKKLIKCEDKKINLVIPKSFVKLPTLRSEISPLKINRSGSSHIPKPEKPLDILKKKIIIKRSDGNISADFNTYVVIYFFNEVHYKTKIPST
jgi:hypothetical protein